jgi:probable HAF family extracellular repeat protein
MPAEPGQPVSAWALNDLGQVVGSTPFRNSQTQALENHAFLWDGETMDDLGSGGGLGTVALDVNDAGHVVGFQGIGDPTGTGPVTRRAFFYDGQMWTFDGLGDGLAINDTDQIVASGWDAYTGNPRAFLLTPRSPSRVISGLIGAIDGFVLPKGLETGLVSKLEAALAAIERGDSDAACGELGAFINHVEAQRGKGLTDEQADALVAGATQARTLLGCS